MRELFPCMTPLGERTIFPVTFRAKKIMLKALKQLACCLNENYNNTEKKEITH